MKNNHHQIKTVYPQNDYILYVNFVNGKTVLYDIKPLLKENYYKKLKDKKLFNKVKNDGYGIHWNKDIDLDSEELYKNGKTIKDPFENLISFKDATHYWKLSESTLRKAVQYGKLRKGIDCIKFGNAWVATKEAIIREYGQSEATRDANFVYNKSKPLLEKDDEMFTDEQFKSILKRNKLNNKAR